MAFILRLLASAVLIVLVIVVFLLTVYAIVWVVNKGLQWGAENIGGELGDMFKYIWQKIPKIKFERKVNDKKPESREII